MSAPKLALLGNIGIILFGLSIGWTVRTIDRERSGMATAGRAYMVAMSELYAECDRTGWTTPECKEEN